MSSAPQDPLRVIAHLLRASGAIPNHPRWPLLVYPAPVPTHGGHPAVAFEIERERILSVATAMDVPSCLDLQEIGKRSAWVLPTFWIHPRRAAEYADRLLEFQQHIETSRAIGEIGLDFHWVR